MCEAFRRRFDSLPGARAIRARYEDLGPHDCFVTAGNSYGQMSAGIDAAIARAFGERIQREVQGRILDDFLGEQPVGTAFVVPTGEVDRPFLIHAPTMRTPGSIEGTDKVYQATWAALLAVHRHNRTPARRIEIVAFPAMGTGFGGVPFDEAARQMAAAYRHFLSPPRRLDWDVVAGRQLAIAHDNGVQVVR